MSILGIPLTFGYVASPSNYQAGTWEKSGTTKNGSAWKMSQTNCRDCEDNDTSRNFSIGDLTFYAGEDRGRDWASNVVSVTHGPSGVSVSSKSEWGRSGENRKDSDDKSRAEMRNYIAVAAAKEGMSPSDFAQALPSEMASFLTGARLV